MSIAYVNSAWLGYQSSGFILTSTYTVGASSTLLVVGGYTSFADDVTGVTVNGTAMTLFDKAPQNGAGTNWLYGFYLSSPPTGLVTIIVTKQFSSDQMGFVAGDYSGVVTSGALDAHSNNNVDTGSDVSLTSTLTTWFEIFCFIFINSSYDNSDTNVPPIAGAGTTRRAFDTTFGACALFDSNGPLSAGSNSLTQSQSTNSTGISHVTAAFSPAAGGGDTLVGGQSMIMMCNRDDLLLSRHHKRGSRSRIWRPDMSIKRAA